MSPPPSGKASKASNLGQLEFLALVPQVCEFECTQAAVLCCDAVAGVTELLIFHPVDTVAKRLMSNKAKVIHSFIRNTQPQVRIHCHSLGFLLNALHNHLP